MSDPEPSRSFSFSRLRSFFFLSCRRIAVHTLFAVACLSAFTSPVQATQLLIEPPALQRALSEQVFQDKGRYWLMRAGCYAYLSDPTVKLADSRVFIRAKLSGRVGIDLGNDCLGTDVSPYLTVSALPSGAGSELHLTDIRVERVESDMGNLIRPLLQRALPRAIRFDLQPTIDQAVAEALAYGWSVAVDQFEFKDVTVARGAIAASLAMTIRAK